MGYIIGIALLIVLIFVFFAANKSDNRNNYEPYNQREQREIEYAGAVGETIFRNQIKDILCHDDILINNIPLEVNGKQAEIDSLIINKNGIFIIEIKNYNGMLYGDVDDYEWIKEKVSPGGDVFTKTVKNPIRQVKRQIYILSQYLKDNHIRIWIKGYVYFINNNSPIEDECVINNIEKLDYIIHEQQDKVYDEQLIHSAINLLSENNTILQ